MSETLTLTPQMGTVFAILAFAIYLFVFEIVRVDVAAILIMLVLGLTNIVPPNHLFDGFASNAVISIIAVMVLGAGLDRTGLMTRLAAYILKLGGSSEKRVVPIVSATVAIISSFMQNVGAAALFLPVVSRISTRTGIALSRLLMPMGFCAILGGTLTMVGSSPLILLNDLIVNANKTLPDSVEPLATFHLFSVAPVGLALVVVGVGYFMLLGKFVLPSARGATPEPGVTSRYLEQIYGIQGDIYEARVLLDSPLIGQSVAQVEALENAPYVVGVFDGKDMRVEPPGPFQVPAGAVMAFMGTEGQVREFCRNNKLNLNRRLEVFMEALSPSRAGIAEIVIPPGSTMIGNTIVEIRLRRRFGASLLAIYRGEEALRTDLRERILRAGDTLIVHSRWPDLQELSEDRNFVVVTDFPRQEVVREHKVKEALSFFTLALCLVLFTPLPVSVCLLTGAMGMVVSGVLTIDEGYRAVSWQTVFLLASLIPFGMAMETTGTAAWIAQQTLNVLGDVPQWVLMAALALLTTAFTLVMSNVGATVLLVPVAINMAIGVGANPAVFALTVALATSNSFLIPTHQVNALIMGPAGYRVTDFLRAGGIMTLLFLIVIVGMLNLVY
ncbi:MAG: SLC13 family permease [Gammaproteobacteria bacterium]|nr:SLC13 family permease [Gammaproteobacteria bacterium]